jgi:hypothetical protein
VRWIKKDLFINKYIRIWFVVCCCIGRIFEVNIVRLLVFQDACPLICGVTANRQGFVDDDNDVELLINDEDGVGCCPLDEGIPDEL